MTNRLSLRDIIVTKELEKSSAEERFQTQTLRPILKLQNELIIGLFKNHIADTKNTFYGLTLENRIIFIENSLQKNVVLKNKFLGLVLGMFTIEEFAVYSANASLYNKRISSLVVERIRSQIALLQ